MEHSLITCFSLAHSSIKFPIVYHLVNLSLTFLICLLDHVFCRCLYDSSTNDGLLLLLRLLTGLFVFLFDKHLLLISDNHGIIGNKGSLLESLAGFVRLHRAVVLVFNHLDRLLGAMSDRLVLIVVDNCRVVLAAYRVQTGI